MEASILPRTTRAPFPYLPTSYRLSTDASYPPRSDQTGVEVAEERNNPTGCGLSGSSSLRRNGEDSGGELISVSTKLLLQTLAAHYRYLIYNGATACPFAPGQLLLLSSVQDPFPKPAYKISYLSYYPYSSEGDLPIRDSIISGTSL